MATTAISNIFEALPWTDMAQERMIYTNAFSRSGIAVPDANLSAKFASGGRIQEMDFYGPLSVGTEPRLDNDTPATSDALTHQNVSDKTAYARVSYRNQSWSTMNLARALASQDPVTAITNQVGDYWAYDNQQRLIASLNGILADNVANDSGDMLKSVATDADAAVTDAERISAENVLDALQTLGDAKNQITAIAMHSVIHNRLLKNNLIDTTPDSEQNIGFGTYLQKTIIVDDTLPRVAGTYRYTYTCALFGSGAIAMANAPVALPMELFRAPYSGNGGGEEILYSRVANTFHPYGFSFLSGSVAGASPTRAELALAANWNRVVDRKHIPMAFLKVNEDLVS